ncbi:Glyoxalase/Bleomycin resistance protein/Dihydroxybiphenyl dioxygenase [Penicillium cinerascens]|uniref:Glyoxalase/Bleomycin resistance protein/Dihydroxybiphenyl dioxygenase n=1 Tax=Penicillium cinerascens TaxID=70096 RepID=A0A9W9TD80_9EURO|nr:Glyoxalase/Bleomycin resistance protein/Dihydroxybiphenyl dioxygenase [Penicillium cinerascens]KAJ5218448.1 Glyoxalase/Bleomycin resistance protein/Dihydroxybiphenyl dioxygenase [Penicillium cinerascens]
MAIDHTSFYVPEEKFQQCLKFYLEALKPLGYQIRYQFGEFVVGLGSRNEDFSTYQRADFWVFGTKTILKRPAHIAFKCHDHASVDAFHAAAIKAGGKDNGSPGLRSSYHPNYYGAFVIDPSGNNIEAVDHGVYSNP